VKNIKKNIESSKSKLDDLKASMQQINTLTGTITDQLSTKHKEIVKLDKVNKDLKKLDSLCKFPDNIKRDLDAFNKSDKKDLNCFNNTI
jgi:vacuolar protein sorting-associated protein 51